MARIGKALLVFLTIVLFLVSTAFAVELLLIDGAESVEFVDRQTCQTSLGYYTENELECDGFVIWLIYFVPLWFILAPVWLLYMVESGWRRPKVFHSLFEREFATKGVSCKR